MSSVAVQNTFSTVPELVDVPSSATTEEESSFPDLSGYFLTTSGGNVHLERKLGSGTYGVVYSAVHQVDQESYALTLVSTAEYTGDDKYFDNELEILHAVAESNHEHIVAYFGYETAEELPDMAMFFFELAPLSSVSVCMEQNGHCLSMEMGLEVSAQLCDGLAFLHSQGIYHRDIRADNLLLTGEIHVKITDFGLAEYHPEKDVLLYDRYTSFPPPEFYKDGCYFAVHADLWAATMTLIYMVTGECPWNEANESDNRFRHFVNQLDDPACSDQLKRCRERALGELNPNPFERTLPRSYSDAVEKYWSPL